jgi:allophanate hydrolase
VPVVPPDPSLTGHWRRTLLVRPDGSTDTGTSVSWLQAGAYYVDLRLPAGPARSAPAAPPPAELLARAAVEGFAGRVRADGGWTCWERTVDLQPPAPCPDEGRLEPQGAGLVETGRHERYVEHWARWSGPDEDFCAVELRDEATGAPAVLLRVGDDVGWARGRPAPLPAGGTLADLVAGGDPAAVRAAFDAEVALGTVTPDGGVVRTASSLPFRAGEPLDLAADGAGLRGADTAPDGSPVVRRWRVVATEGTPALLPVRRPHPAPREVRSA